MAVKKNVKPLFDVKFDFVASLDRFVHEAGMMRDFVRQAVELGVFDAKPGLKEMARERVKAFDMASAGDGV